MNDLEKLRTENLQLSVRAQRYSAVKRENSRLRDLLDFPVVPNQRTIVANILSIDTKSGSQQIVVNKGKNTGAQVGQAMVDVHGVIGQVIKVGPYSAIGLLITDPKHSIPVELNRTGLRAVVTGIDESKKLSLSFVPIDADVVTGDLVVSSGLGADFLQVILLEPLNLWLELKENHLQIFPLNRSQISPSQEKFSSRFPFSESGG